MNPVPGGQNQDLGLAPSWGFLTNHAHVLFCIARDPGTRLRDIAVAVGVTERAAHRIVSELVEAGYVLREREGRRNRYEVVTDGPLRHPLLVGRQVGELLEVLLGPGAADAKKDVSKLRALTPS